LGRTGIDLPEESGILNSENFAILETLKFVFEVVTPFLGEQWGLCAIHVNEEYGDHYERFLNRS
jgi:hypothetical protein